MKKCWANSLGNCRGKITGEHIISQSVFINETLKISGFDWCKDEIKEIGLGRLTKNILCEHHNSALSELDGVAGKFMSDLRRFEHVNSIRNKNQPKNPTVEKYCIDGKLLERWFLKTLINLSSFGDLPIGNESNLNSKPSQRLVEIAYGLDEFKPLEGLYTLNHKNVIRGGETYKITPIYNSDKYVAGGVFDFRGFIFLLSIENVHIFDFLFPLRETASLISLNVSSPVHHLQNIEALTRKRKLSQRIVFEW